MSINIEMHYDIPNVICEIYVKCLTQIETYPNIQCSGYGKGIKDQVGHILNN